MGPVELGLGRLSLCPAPEMLPGRTKALQPLVQEDGEGPVEISKRKEEVLLLGVCVAKVWFAVARPPFLPPVI